MKTEEIIKTQSELNRRLGILFKKNNIKKFRLISLGNSIASGYSASRTIKPLFLRNEDLKNVMNSYDITFDHCNFARAQNNGDEHIFEWLVTNIKESEIHKMNRSDYSDSPTSMKTNLINPQVLDQLYPLTLEEDRGLQDLIKESDSSLANIVVYSGCTGSFLDNLTRGGKLSQMFAYGIKRDMKSMDAVLNYIQACNRKNNSNTQVYICGAPNYLGTNISAIINRKLKKITKKYANVTYVEPVKAKLIYKNVATNKLQFDIHYSEQEYNELNNHIFEAIRENYLINKAMINVDRSLYLLSSNIELENKYLVSDNKKIQGYIANILLEEEKLFFTFAEKEDFYKRAKDYLLDRVPYDYFYLGKSNLRSIIDNKNKHIDYMTDEEILKKVRLFEFDKLKESSEPKPHIENSPIYGLKRDNIIQDDISIQKKLVRNSLSMEK